MFKDYLTYIKINNTVKINRFLSFIKAPQLLYGLKSVKLIKTIFNTISTIISEIVFTNAIYMALLFFSVNKLGNIKTSYYIVPQLIIMLGLSSAFISTEVLSINNALDYCIKFLRVDIRNIYFVRYTSKYIKSTLGFYLGLILLKQFLTLPMYILYFPIGILGVKIFTNYINIRIFEKFTTKTFERIGIARFIISFLLFAISMLSIKFEIIIDNKLILSVLVIYVILGLFGLYNLIKYDNYQNVIRLYVNKVEIDINEINYNEKNDFNKSLSIGNSSKNSGIKYFNDIFIKRHKKLLIKKVKIVSIIILVLLIGVIALFNFIPNKKSVSINDISLAILFFVYVMNSSNSYIKALYYNSDDSMLNYSFFRKKDILIPLFLERLKTLLLLNIIPALLLGVAIGILFYRFENIGIEYIGKVVILPVILTSIISIIFILIYYLTQPFSREKGLNGKIYNGINTIIAVMAYTRILHGVNFDLFFYTSVIILIILSIIVLPLVKTFSPKKFKVRK